MIPVYYDESSENWKKADIENKNPSHKWYDYNKKVWANSVTVTETNRATYLEASPGTEIPMDDILTMEVWIPRYKYKVFNYNENGTTYVEPQSIDITFENGTAKTGEITCSDTISVTDGAPSETCKLKSTNETCTDSTCNGKYYTHPAFTFGTEELEGIWVGKFEVSSDIECTPKFGSALGAGCNLSTIRPLVKPDVVSWRGAQLGTFETNMMAMNDSGNQYGFSTTDDTHMMKNSEWGAVAYLSHSKYGKNSEVYINNSFGYYTGRSGGKADSASTAVGTYKYNEKKEINEIVEGTGTEKTLSMTTNDSTNPWTSTGGLYKSTTQGKDLTETNLTFKFNVTSKSALTFDWSVSSEFGSYDYLYYTIKKDGTVLSGTGESTAISGTDYGTTESSLKYLSVIKELDNGNYELIFTYKKDVSTAKGTDTGYVKNVKLVEGAKIKTSYVKGGELASTTGNIYGIYDMSGGASEYVMGNVVSPDGTTMVSGYSNTGEYVDYHSGYTGILYEKGTYANYTGVAYPANKYIDKYSFGTSYTQKVRSKLGDAIKEVGTSSWENWYGDYGYVANASDPWFDRGGDPDRGTETGLFYSIYDNGAASSRLSARLVIAQ